MGAFKKAQLEELIGIMQTLSPATLASFLEDILTPQEFKAIIERWQLVKMLKSGVPQRTVAKKLGVSIAKITRGSRALQNKRGGFNQVLKKIK